MQRFPHGVLHQPQPIQRSPSRCGSDAGRSRLRSITCPVPMCIEPHTSRCATPRSPPRSQRQRRTHGTEYWLPPIAYTPKNPIGRSIRALPWRWARSTENSNSTTLPRIAILAKAFRPPPHIIRPQSRLSGTCGWRLSGAIKRLLFAVIRRIEHHGNASGTFSWRHQG